MYLHANAKLGLAGRFALVEAIEEGMSLRAAAAAFSVSPATAHRWWHRWLEAGEEARCTLLSARSLEPSAPLATAARAGAAGADLRLPPQTGWGPRLVAGATGFAHSTVWKVLKRAGLSRRAASGQGAGQPLRVALPRRSAAHGHEPLRALPAARPPGHRRPLAALTQLDAPRDEGRLRLRARDRRRPLAARLRRAPRRRESRDRHRPSSNARSPSSPSTGSSRSG